MIPWQLLVKYIHRRTLNQCKFTEVKVVKDGRLLVHSWGL